MHLLGRFRISLIFYDLYGGLLSELCNDPGASLYQCTREATEGTPLKYYDPPSYIFQSDVFSVVCDIRIMTEFLECRSNITNSCPDWRDDGPGMSNEESFKAFIIGTCLNRHVEVDDVGVDVNVDVDIDVRVDVGVKSDVIDVGHCVNVGVVEVIVYLVVDKAVLLLKLKLMMLVLM
ncbi:uncharacterized protein LOC134701709 [Mytilus trossulus]|uniref:uncharacterized protein LOC134701709 n=1 Tax=Mytilus trossulus TaxID=6551 RepID=UPI003004472A